jgi:hypothetical protein
VIGFNKYKGYPVSGKAPGDAVPEALAGHVGFWMSYDEMGEPEETYHWGYRCVNSSNGALPEYGMLTLWCSC